MSIAALIATLEEKGVDAATIVAAVKAISPMLEGKQRSQSAERQARYRERKAKSVTSDVTSDVTPSFPLVPPAFLPPTPPNQTPPYNPPTNENVGSGIADADVRATADAAAPALPKVYPEDFETRFWQPYPRSPTMSKKEALAAWRKLTPADRDAACQAVPHFAAYCRENPTYPPVHACRFLSQRRFEGFNAQAPPRVDNGFSALTPAQQEALRRAFGENIQ